MEVLGMIDITNCNKIIVDTIGKTEKIIEWYQQNKDWLDAEEFRIPIPSALVELPEEDIKFYYEQEGVFVRLHLYMGGVYVCNYRYDPKTQEIENIVFPAGLSKEKRKVARMVLAADRTPEGECVSNTQSYIRLNNEDRSNPGIRLYAVSNALI
jgi:hypothetical protein